MKKLHPLIEEMGKLVQEQNDLKFEEFIRNNKDFLLKENPLAFISYQIDYYALKDDFFKTLEVVNYYKNAPYISMEVEDFLNEMKAKLEKYKEPKEKTYTQDDIRKALFSSSENTIAAAFTYLDKQNVRMYLSVIEEFLLSEKVEYKYKTLALFILIQQHVDKELKMVKNGMIYTLTPSLLDLPFDTYEYELCKKAIEADEAAPSIKNAAVEIMNTVQIKEFPDSYLEMDNIELMKDIFIAMAASYSTPDEKKETFDLRKSQVALKNNVSFETVDSMVKELNLVITK